MLGCWAGSMIRRSCAGKAQCIRAFSAQHSYSTQAITRCVHIKAAPRSSAAHCINSISLWCPKPHQLPPIVNRRRLIMSTAAASNTPGSADWLGGKPDHGAYIDASLHVAGTPGGVLSGTTVAVKDLFDVAGHKTGFGQPTWLDTHPPATSTAPAVQQLLDAGADVRGKTHMDELAYSLNGENKHYGTPMNPAAPGRIPGGSSSGSVVAVVAGHVDIGLGSDTGGSVRVPASYCGVFGIRPTHGRVSLDGARPLAHSFDTVGWFTRKLSLMKTVGKVLLDPTTANHQRLTQIIWPLDAWEMAQAPTASALHSVMSGGDAAADAAACMSHLAGVIGDGRPAKGVQVADTEQLRAAGLGHITDWLDVFRICQAGEIWEAHGSWITQHKPEFGPGVKERFIMASGITPQEWEVATGHRKLITSRLKDLVKDGGVIVMPTAPGPAPLCNTPAAQLDDWRRRLISLTCLAGLSGLPQVSIPLVSVDGLPVGLSLLGGQGSDESLLDAAESLLKATRPDLL